MAKARSASRAITLRPVINAARPAPIVVNVPRPRPMVATKRKKGHRRRGSGGAMTSGLHWKLYGAAWVLGKLDSAGSLASLPTVPMLGKAGTLAVGAHVLAKYMHMPWAYQVRDAFAVIAMYQLGKQGSIDGDEGDEIAGVASQV